MSTRQWSGQQTAIFEWFETGTGHLIVRARAGTGKTTTIIEGINHAPETSILLCAFNKRIAEELTARLNNPRAQAKTLHSVGFACVRKFRDNIRVGSGSSTAQKLNRADSLTSRVCNGNAPDAVKRLVSKLHTKGREIVPHATKYEELIDIAVNHECEPDEQWQNTMFNTKYVVLRALDAMELASKVKGGEEIDFADMIYLPVRNGWISKQHNLVVVDECLPGYTPVMLADGGSKTIKEIVESSEETYVRSFDTATNQSRNCKVIARQRILNQKPLVKIKAQTAVKDLGGHLKSRFVICTVDHKIWTINRGWIEAGQIHIGDQIIWENSAQTTLTGMIGGKGRKHLSEIHIGNTKGIGNPGSPDGPIRRGGNGQETPLAEQVLFNALGSDWVSNYILPVGNQLDGQGFPSHYKIDIANPEKKIAVEVDGPTHRHPVAQERDLQKDCYLKACGWTVFRVSNQRAIQNTLEEVHRITGNSPLPATVISVESTVIRDNYVYDITVEDCHNFYANGILVHNCQDMTTAQLEIAQGVCDGRVCCVGDDKQAVYGFRGADCGSLDRLKAELQAEELGLTTTYRCGKLIVDLAKQLVPDFEAHESNQDGEVLELKGEDLVECVAPGDFVLSRVNAPLVGTAISLLRAGKRARIAGRDIGGGLKTLIRKLAKGRAANSIEVFLERVGEWESRESARLMAAGQEARIETINDQAAMLREFSDGADDVESIIERIDALFTDDGLGQAGIVTCSSVHRAKGLEANRVFVLNDTLKRHSQEELNIIYVAFTRAIKSLVLVHGKARKK